MKKYLMAFGIVAILAAIAIAVAVGMNGNYIQRLSFDHVGDTSYNGIRIVGKDGLFYLAKDGKIISDGYRSLKSVNDYYDKDLLESKSGTSDTAVLFGYYLARTEESASYALISADGDEYVIVGESYTLDRTLTSLPYLVFTDNKNGTLGALSLHRLDSDLSYRSGSELTLCAFSELSPQKTDSSELLCTYMSAQNTAGRPSYFRYDGISIADGAQIDIMTLQKDGKTYPFFHDTERRHIVSHTGELIASGVIHLLRDDGGEWQYVLCEGREKQTSHAVIFSPDKALTVTSDIYNISSPSFFGSNVILGTSDGQYTDMINAYTSRTVRYLGVKQFSDSELCVAQSLSGEYEYIYKDGTAVLKSEYSDLLPIPALSTPYCHALSSQKAGESYIFFAARGTQPYRLDASEYSSVTLLENTDERSAYLLTKETDGQKRYAVLAPFSLVKISEAYDSITPTSHSGISYLLAVDSEKKSYDIIDPTTAKVQLSLHDSESSYTISPIEQCISLHSEGTQAHLLLLAATKSGGKSLGTDRRYFLLYRTADGTSLTSHLQTLELDKDLLLSQPYTAFEDFDCLVTYTASGSSVYTLDSEGLVSKTAELNGRTAGILRDSASGEHYYITISDMGLYGAYNSEGESVLPESYESIEHAEGGYFKVKTCGAYGVVSVKRNRVETVLKPIYTVIVPLGENGYLATDSEGRSFVYHKKRTVLEAVQSCKEVKAYTTDDEGHLSVRTQYIINADGRLFIRE